MKTAREVVELYNYELWNKQRYELADELISETWLRHEIGSVTTLTRAEAKQRVIDRWSIADRLEFRLLHTITEGELVTIIYEAHVMPKGGGDEIVASSIEVYRVVDGQICEVWNPARTLGSWQ